MEGKETGRGGKGDGKGGEGGVKRKGRGRKVETPPPSILTYAPANRIGNELNFECFC